MSEHQQAEVDGFGRFLLHAMANAGYKTPTALARDASLSPSVILRWTRNEVVPSVRVLQQVAPLLNVPEADLIAAAYPGTSTERRPTEFGMYLMELMGDRDMRPTQLGAAAAMGASTISRLIYGDTPPPDKRLIARLADALDVPVAELAGRWSGGFKPPKSLPAVLVDLAELLEAGSGLSGDDRERLDAILWHLAASYRGIAHGKGPAPE